ncbi:IclR family transcriptional regulator protein (plasmid) [Rhizobium gallicum]|uniref:IclR family transcriptional regulator protein n=1 Tax=Rhizobium gallicum TaxID=56730 RepID=A0A1L5NS39_9HYPH|nr:helix-turn-helix domain-containing protein [Rhizobium gallicum]APO70704.1 IclR family transcriptional regulator protein [Rhizobium gallicum]
MSMKTSGGAEASVRTNGIVKSVARTLETLELFDEVRRPVNIVEVAERLGYPQSSTAALLKSMAAMGFLQYDKLKRTFFPTDRLPLAGSWMSPLLYGGSRIMHLVDKVAERSGRIVVVGSRSGDEVIYCHVSNPSKSIGLEAGTRRPLARSVVGHVLLSTMTNDEVARAFRRINAYRPEGEDPVDVKSLIATLEQIRKDGYFAMSDLLVEGVGLVAVLMPAECTERPLCLAIGAPSHVIAQKKSEFVEILREEIDHQFGEYRRQIVAQRAFEKPVRRAKIRAAGMN